MLSLLGFFGAPGPMEMLIIAMIALLLFGNRLPSVMRSMGRGIVEFKKGVQGIEDDVDDAVTRSVSSSEKKEGEKPA
jgi:sec-independent protein translocase protein TatA